MDAVITIEADLNAIIKEVCIGKYKFQQNLKSVYCLYLQPCMIMHLSAAISGGVTPGNPRAFAQRRLQIPPTQKEDFLTKSYKRPSPGGKEVCFAKSNSAFENIYLP